MNIDTKWIKTGKAHDFVFIGKDVIATASGNHILFYNLTSKEKHIEYFNSVSRGDGVSCIAGHPMIPIFSTAERCCKPKIYVHTYPEMKKVAECKSKENPNIYVSCCFAGTEYLLSLSSFPNFQLTIWLWRTGQRIASVESNLRSEIQIIESSIHSFNLIYQFAPELKKLLTYEIHAYSKNVSIIKNEVKSVKFKIKYVCWTKIGSLLVSDEFKNVYIVSSDGKKSQRILCESILSIEDDNYVLVAPLHTGFVTADNNLEIKYYSKSVKEVDTQDNWEIIWTIKCTSRPIKMTLSHHTELIFIYCENGQIFQLCLTYDFKPVLEEILNDCQKFKFICLLRPLETYSLLVSQSNSLMVINNFDGNVSGSLQIDRDNQVSDIATHPSLPLTVACTTSGKCIYFTVNSGKLEEVKTIHYQREPLNKVKFSESGSVVGVVSTITNNVFLTKTVFDQDIDVFTHIKLENCTIDFLIYDEKEKFVILILIESLTVKTVGNFIEVCTINKIDKSFCKEYKIFMYSYYQSLRYGLKISNNFLGIPYLSKQLHIFNIKDDYKSITLENIVLSTLKLRNYSVCTTDNYILFSGYDGNIVLKKSSDLTKVVNTCIVHHYQEKGTLQSVLSIQNKIIICLGKNGSLIGLQFGDSHKETETKVSRKSKNIEKPIWNQLKTKNLSSNYVNVTWLEQKAQEEYQKIAAEILNLKNLISGNFEILKLEIKHLLDVNEAKCIDFRLPLSVFDIDIERRKQKIEIASHVRDEKKVILQAVINKKKEIIDYLMSKFFKLVKIHNLTLTSFDSKILITNFSLLHERNEKIYDSSIELFNTPKSNSLIKYVEDKNDQLSIEAFSDIKISDKSSEVVNNYFLLHYDNEIAFTGSTSCKWIENDIPPNQLTQKPSAVIHQDYSSSRENKLKVKFNEEFEATRNLKNLVLEKTADRVKKVTYYKNELKNVFGIVTENDLYQPIKQYLVMSPESIQTSNITDIDLFDPNINDESNDQIRQDVCDSKNIEKKPNTAYFYDLLKFREEKLNEMMDGCLEIRWEDEVKKDIPKPECLISKSPSMYDDKDKELIKNYEEKVKQLEALRLKYRSHLQSEIHELNKQIEEDVQSFDKKMEEFSLKKINMKSAILQEFLLRFRKQKEEFLKNFKDRNVASMTNSVLALLEEEQKCLTDEISEVELVLIELRGKYESLTKRDKILEGKFKGEFNELKQPLVDHLSRQYKRRPRIAKITCTSLTFLSEASKCLMAGKKSLILPIEYLDFLRGMDALDVMPNSLPPQIDSNHWQMLCKLRRIKVEVEIKLRIAALEVAEAEQTFFHLQKMISLNQSKLLAMKNNIEEETLKETRSMENPEIQLVIKSAQLEIPTTGHVTDFEKATVVTCKQLVEVSNDIVNRGNKKISAMRALVKVKKSIVYRNWKYQFMVKKIKHLKEHLHMLRNTKIGKKMQKYLIDRLEGIARCKDVISCAKMLRSVNKKFERMEKSERSNLLKITTEIKHWQNQNTELMEKIDEYLTEKRKKIIILENDSLIKKNQIFHKKILHLIKDRTQLVENVKNNFVDIMNMQAQLDLLKFKTYPVLSYKNVYYNLKKTSKN